MMVACYCVRVSETVNSSWGGEYIWGILLGRLDGVPGLFILEACARRTSNKFVDCKSTRCQGRWFI